MKYRLLAVPIVGLSLGCLQAPVWAEDEFERSYNFSLEGTASIYKYEEPELMNLKGKRGGGAGSISSVDERGVLTAFEASYAIGLMDYESNGTGSAKDFPDYYYEMRAKIGRQFSLGAATLLPYLGFGWRHLVNDSEGEITTTGHYGYKRVSDYYYLPIGLDWRSPFGGKQYLELNAEYDLILRGTQHSYLPNATILNTQNHGYGLRASAVLGFGRWAFGPYVNHWKIADSTLADCAPYVCLEPKNSTTETGLRIRYSFQ